MTKIKMLLRSVLKNWFLIGIVVFIFVAHQMPWIGVNNGPLYPQFTIKYLAVIVIFFNSGLSLRPDDLSSAFFSCKIHLLIQLFTFFFIPVFIYLIVEFLKSITNVNEYLLRGILVVSCMPPPVSSAVIITKSIGGNEANAVFNSALGSFLGIFITPVTLFGFVGVSGSIPIMQIVTQLTITVVIPLILGQVVRSYVKNWLERKKPPLSGIGSFMLLLIIFGAFCDTFSSNMDGLGFSDLLFVIMFILVMQLLLLRVIFVLSTKLNFSKENVVAVMFCSTHKSLTLGIPILKIIYMNDPFLPFLCIPLLIYHPSQILLGGFLVPHVKSWLYGKRRSFARGV
ncbi:sodium/bile acid cotransporter 7 [Hydra vulgaris]|uniref:Sodium/bile acid cotransporter 7 n=1 Tax=Hydra vulgaris TaxID=6087 RepID=T2MDW2_HYDVU|nr:sodium/bile acid cotransporter 7 [Hydra vulgaris]